MDEPKKAFSRFFKDFLQYLSSLNFSRKTLVQLNSKFEDFKKEYCFDASNNLEFEEKDVELLLPPEKESKGCIDSSEECPSLFSTKYVIIKEGDKCVTRIIEDDEEFIVKERKSNLPSLELKSSSSEDDETDDEFSHAAAQIETDPLETKESQKNSRKRKTPSYFSPSSSPSSSLTNSLEPPTKRAKNMPVDKAISETLDNKTTNAVLSTSLSRKPRFSWINLPLWFFAYFCYCMSRTRWKKHPTWLGQLEEYYFKKHGGFKFDPPTREQVDVKIQNMRCNKIFKKDVKTREDAKANYDSFFYSGLSKTNQEAWITKKNRCGIFKEVCAWYEEHFEKNDPELDDLLDLYPEDKEIPFCNWNFETLPKLPQ